MRAIIVGEHGGPEVLVAGEAAEPVPGQGEVVIEVAAAGVNFVDVYHRTGRYPTTPPFIPGVEAAGTVVAVGPDVAEIQVGDVVGAADLVGGYAQRALVPAGRAVAVPGGLSAEDAAAALLQGMTAHYLTRTTYPVQAGDSVLVHAAAGGMGLMLTQMVKMRGGRVIGTVSTAEKEKLARDAGADEIVSYDGFAGEVRRLTGGEGVAVVYDGVGARTFDESLASLRRRGTLALYGAASGPVPPVDPMRLNTAGSVFLTRPSLVHHIADPAELASRSRDLFGWVSSGALKLHVGRRYPVADARIAHEDLEGRRTTGKLLLIP